MNTLQIATANNRTLVLYVNVLDQTIIDPNTYSLTVLPERAIKSLIQGLESNTLMHIQGLATYPDYTMSLHVIPATNDAPLALAVQASMMPRHSNEYAWFDLTPEMIKALVNWLAHDRDKLDGNFHA